MTREEAQIALANLKRYISGGGAVDRGMNKAIDMAIKALEEPEQRWIPCGKCIHADGKHRWCKVLDRTINEDYFCYWAEPFRGEGEADG